MVLVQVTQSDSIVTLLSLKWLSTFRYSQLLIAISDDVYVMACLRHAHLESSKCTDKSNYTPLICEQLTRALTAWKLCDYCRRLI